MIFKKKFVINAAVIFCLVAIAVGWRIINYKFQVVPNLELVTTVSILAAVILGWRAALIVPLTTMAISDAFIGNSPIFMFTWGSFALIGLGAMLLRKLNAKPKSQILYSIGFAAASSFVFFLVTNFGVWTMGWYPATWAGLGECFMMAIPFYRTMLIGNVILVPSAITIWQVVKARQIAKSLVINPLVGN